VTTTATHKMRPELHKATTEELLAEVKRRIEADRLHPLVVAICKEAGMDPNLVVSVNRTKPVCLVRDACAAALIRSGHSSVATGMILGGRDHATVSLAAKRHRERMGLCENDG